MTAVGRVGSGVAVAVGSERGVVVAATVGSGVGRAGSGVAVAVGSELGVAVAAAVGSGVGAGRSLRALRTAAMDKTVKTMSQRILREGTIMFRFLPSRLAGIAPATASKPSVVYTIPKLFVRIELMPITYGLNLSRSVDLQNLLRISLIKSYTSRSEKSDVFLSYQHTDQAKALELAKYLDRQGREVFIDIYDDTL